MQNRYLSTLIGIVIYFPFFLSAQLTLNITSVPNTTPIGDTIFVAGTFNEWSTDHPDFIMEPQEDGTFSITISPTPGELKYKFTRGSWETVESNAQGGFLPDRILQYDGTSQTASLTIQGWEDLRSNSNSTAASNVRILQTDFFIPQLNRNRRIWIYLPPDYDNSEKKYPVLYLQDGQNIFDRSTSFSGEWQVDESLNALFQQGDYGIIAVAIDNGSGNRTNEYTPWPDDQYGGGEGAQYVDFIVETLKPHIDENFRTLSQPKHTGIIGSSLGGLISHYAIMKYQDVFGKAGIFSPAFWINNPEIFDFTENQGKKNDLKIYLLGGERESSTLISELNQMRSILLNLGFTDEQIFLKTDADGQHAEWYWAREFPAAYQWLFNSDEIVDVEDDLDKEPTITISPNPASDSIFLSNLNGSSKYQLKVFNLSGQHLWSKKIQSNSMDISFLKSGTYIFNVYEQEELVVGSRIVVQ